MKRVAGLLVGLILVGWILIEVPVARTQQPAAARESDWRRTVDGWERVSSWSAAPKVRPAELHPMVVGAMELALSLTALVALSGTSRRTASDTTAVPNTRTRQSQQRRQNRQVAVSQLPSIR